ncbi:MAG TPA: AMP-binding protein [Terriglobia bacterium]|nr:AMP-binding protein [Terriglobia bacterium]
MNVLLEVSGPPLVEAAPDGWLFERIGRWATDAPGRFAFAIDREGGPPEEYTYRDVRDISERLAAGLAAEGIARQDRVGILMENTPQWVFALLGILRIGAVVVPLPTLLPADGVANLVAHSGCRWIFVDRQNLAKAEQAAPEKVRLVIFGGEDAGAPFGRRLLTWDRLCGSGGPAPPMPADNGAEAALIVYTSGTTGDPKGAELSVRNLVYEVRGAIEALQFSRDHRILSTLPFSHVLPLIANALGPLAAGAGVVFLSQLSSESISHAFHRRRITCFVCVPQFFYLLHQRIFAAVRDQPLFARWIFRVAFGLARRSRSRVLRRVLFRGVRGKLGPDLWLLASGGARLDPQVGRDLGALGYTVAQAYGLTETTAAATITSLDTMDADTVGRPIRGVSIRIDQPKEDGNGEVWIRGPVVMTGYYRDPEKTRQVMTDGWLRTGDLGYIRSDGNLVITGRSKDVIVLANGKNIYPEELERHYGQSPYIKEICVIGLPADSGPAGETLHAVVVPDLDEFRRRGQTGIREMIQFDLESLSRDLPSYQRVLSFSIRNEPLPRTATRKIRRFEVRGNEVSRRTARPAAPVREAGSGGGSGQGADAVVAKLLREVRPDRWPIDPSMSLELDLGLDSLARVELLAKAEALTGARVDERDAARVMTVGDLSRVLEEAQSGPARGQSWTEIIQEPMDAGQTGLPVFHRGWLMKIAGYAAIKTAGLLASWMFPVRARGVENLPADGPFLLCPNHQSFLDGPLVVAQLPRAVIDKIVILGYSDYWQSTLMRATARFLSVVSIDSNINLVRAMQVGAAGLREGCVLLVFPEGSRSIDGRVMGFKKGAAILACALDVPVAPVGIRGAFEAWPRNGTFRFRPIEIAFGVPLHPGQFSGESDPVEALTQALRARVRELAGQE